MNTQPEGAGPSANYPLKIGDIARHFEVSTRTARRYQKRLPHYLVHRKTTLRGDLRFKEETIPWLEAYIKHQRGF